MTIAQHTGRVRVLRPHKKPCKKAKVRTIDSTACSENRVGVHPTNTMQASPASYVASLGVAINVIDPPVSQALGGTRAP